MASSGCAMCARWGCLHRRHVCCAQVRGGGGICLLLLKQTMCMFMQPHAHNLEC